MKFHFYKQLDAMDCGPTCLKMVAKYYERTYSSSYLRENCFITREGVTLLGISEAAEKIGFRTFAAKLTFEQLDQEGILPCILHWNQNHFVVLPPQNYTDTKHSSKILVADPAHGLIKVDKETFLRAWISSSDTRGVALFLEPTHLFHQQEEQEEKASGFRFLFSYIKPYKKYFLQLCLGLLLASLLSLIFPFLTQSLVD